MVVSGSGQATPRTADGHPDLQGIGDNSTLTPLERPPALAGQAFFSPEDAADYERPERFVERAQARNGDDEAATTKRRRPARLTRSGAAPEHSARIFGRP